MEVICIYGDSDHVCDELGAKLSEGYSILNIQTSLYESTGGLRRDTTVYLSKETVTE